MLGALVKEEKKNMSLGHSHNKKEGLFTLRVSYTDAQPSIEG
jgi:hypothetical protein